MIPILAENITRVEKIRRDQEADQQNDCSERHWTTFPRRVLLFPAMAVAWLRARF
ncbi:MAG: hypothetical protein GTO18_04720 [Anaerolineales bacterium]|nr:hypothetical protein [Anaerolineales bacterium]